MTIDLSNFKIKALIVHEVPRKPPGGGAVDPVLSEIESTLDDEVRSYFHMKIAETMLKVAFCVRFDPNTTSPAPVLIADALGPRHVSLLDMSQKLAHHLNNSQNAVNPGGLLTVIDATLDNKPAIAILKLEKEKGVRLNQTRVSGKLTFNVKQIKDLMLSDRTRVFKVGLFRKNGTAETDVVGDVSDTQTGYQPTKQMADFFRLGFLGCQYCEEPDLLTSRFFESSQRFVNTISDPVLKAKYQFAIFSELSSADQAVDPRGFAQRHLDPEHQDPFVGQMTKEHAPTETFPKDTSRIHNQLQRVQYDFAGGVTVLGTPDALEKTTTLDRLRDGRSRFTITDTLDRLKGHR